MPEAMATPMKRLAHRSIARASRRRMLAAGLGLGAWILVRPAAAAADDLAQAIATFAQGAPVGADRVKLDVAALVDNGNAVPISVSVRSPMSAADHVTAIAIFNERNPQREIATFSLGPRAGRATVSTRIRLATSQKLVAVARMNDGTYWSHTVDVVVTLAACIDGEGEG